MKIGENFLDENKKVKIGFKKICVFP